MRLAIVNKCPAAKRPYDWSKALGTTNYDEFNLSSVFLEKMTVKDIDFDVNTLADYDLVMLVGAEPTKYISKLSGSVVEFQGSLIDNKYIPIINPNMLYFKPQLQGGFDSAVAKIKAYLGGMSTRESTDYKGISCPIEAMEYLEYLSKFDTIAVDTEGTSLYPRNGHTIGISLSATLETGRYIDADIVIDEVYDKMQELFLTKQVVFHNAKYD